MSGCGGGPYDITDALDRAEMMNEVENALTRGDCTTALIHSTRLYESEYSDNRIRMLYVSSQGCRAGINMYEVFEDLSSLSGANPIGEIVRIFPSTTADSRLQSTWAGLDAIQTVLLPGAVVATGDRTSPNAYNSGSVLIQDLTPDARLYGFFMAMALIGTSGNRFGNPDSSFNQGADYPWTTKETVAADTTGSACSLAAGFLWFIDSGRSIADQLPSSAGAALNSAMNLIDAPLVGISARGLDECDDFFSSTACAAAKQRLKYRGACTESTQAAAFAAGVIKGVNAIWLP